MARIEKDREDLMKEATAYTMRAEWLWREIETENTINIGPNDIVLTGFRNNGAFSIYLGSDVVYQFDSEQRLRRAHRDQLLYRSEGDTLSQIKRVKTESKTTLVRADLTKQQCDLFLHQVQKELIGFRDALFEETIQQLRIVGDAKKLLTQLQIVLLTLTTDGPLSLSPSLK